VRPEVFHASERPSLEFPRGSLNPRYLLLTCGAGVGRSGKGHKIHLIIIPELLGLIRRELAAAECEALMDLDAVEQDPSRVLKGIAAWVSISMWFTCNPLSIRV
jgi:hypothetical protein